MDRLDKAIKVMGVAIAGVSVTALILAASKGLIKMPEIDFNKNKGNEVTSEDDSLISRELVSSYQEYISCIANEIRTLELDRSVGRIFATYMYLQENGYITYGDGIEIDADSNIYNPMAIAAGYGNAMNAQRNLQEVFKALGYDAKIVNGYLYSKDNKKDKQKHPVCYVSDNGHAYLFDAYKNAIYLRNHGLYYSMTDPNSVFKPDFEIDKELGNYPGNKDFYFNLENCYKELSCWFFEDYPYYVEEVKSHDEEYQKFEKDNLMGLESKIKDYLDEYEELSKEMESDSVIPHR